MTATFAKFILPLLISALRYLLHGFGFRMKLIILMLLFSPLTLSFPVWAQNASLDVNVGAKKLCQYDPTLGTTCQSLPGSVQFGTIYSYEFDLNAGFSNTSYPAFHVTENYPAEFHPLTTNPVMCWESSSNTPVPVTNLIMGPPMEFDVPVNMGTLVKCRLSGQFVGANKTVVNQVFGNKTPDPGDTTETLDTFLPANPHIDADFILEKAVIAPTNSPTHVDVSSGPQTVTFQITLTRNPSDTSAPVILGPYFAIYDQMSLGMGSMPLSSAFQSGNFTCDYMPAGSAVASQSGVCTPTVVQANPLSQPGGTSDFVKFSFPGTQNPQIMMAPGDKIVLTFDVEIDVDPNSGCILQDPQHFDNQAFLALANGMTGLNDNDTSNNMTAKVGVDVTTGIAFDPSKCGDPIPIPAAPPPAIKLEKTSVNGLGHFTWGTDIEYKVIFRNDDPNEEVFNIHLTDIYQNLAFTPNFDFSLVSLAITQCPSYANCNIPSQLMNPSQMTHYGDNEQLFTATIDVLVPGDFVEITLIVRPENPHCDTAPGYPDKEIQNGVLARFDYKDPNTANLLTSTAVSAVRVAMDEVPACDIAVEKDDLTGYEIDFGVPHIYQIRYSNHGNDVLTMGTVIDALRITYPDYAQSLPVKYEYDCHDVGGVAGYSTDSNGWISTNVNFTNQPNQGLRLMDHPGVVTFQPGAELICNVTIIIDEPPTTDPYCFSSTQAVPEIENTAFMDQAEFYNPNLPFPTSPQRVNWDHVKNELPRCVKLGLTKTVSPSQTGPQGPLFAGFPPTYTVKLENQSGSGAHGAIDFAAGSTNGIEVIDTMTSNPMPNFNLIQDDCSNTSDCDAANFPNTLMVNRFPAQKVLTFEYEALPNPSYMPDKFCNDVQASLLINGQAFDPKRWYIRGNWQQQNVCVDVRNRLTVEKVLDLPPGINVSPSAAFDVTVNCERLASSGYPAMLPEVVTKTLTPSTLTAPHTFWVGSTCTVTEAAPDPAWLPGHCHWEAPVYTPASLTMDASANDWTIQVTNTATCEYTDVTINKQVITASNPQGATAPAGQVLADPDPNTTIQIDVECGDGIAPDPDMTHSFTVGPNGGSSTMPQVPVNMTCTATETILPAPPSDCEWLNDIPATGWVVDAVPHVARNNNNNPSPGKFNIKNMYVCQDDRARFDIVKEFVFTGPVPTQLSLDIHVPNCTNGGTASPAMVTMNWPQDFTNNEARETVMVTDTQPGDPICTIIENVNGSSLPERCKMSPQVSTDGGLTWQAGSGGQVQSSTAVLSNGNSAAEIRIRNTVKCYPHEVELIKTINPPNFPVPKGYSMQPRPPNSQYHIDVQCSGSGVQTPGVTISGGPDGFSQYFNATWGDTCTLTEKITGSVGKQCHWETLYQPSNPIVINANTDAIEVFNAYLCETKPVKTGQFVFDKVVNPKPYFGFKKRLVTPPAGTVYNVTATCTDLAGNVTTHPHTFQAGGGSSTPINLPDGTSCVLTEPLPTNAAKNCAWRQVISPNPVTIQAGLGVTATVKNYYECSWIILDWPHIDLDFGVKGIGKLFRSVPPITGGVTDCTGGAVPEETSFAFNPSEGGSMSKSVKIKPGEEGAFSCQVVPVALPEAPEGCRWGEAPRYSVDGGASWSNEPPRVDLSAEVEAGPKVLIQGDLQCSQEKAVLEVKKTCTPNPLKMTAPGVVQATCALSVTGNDIPDDAILQLRDEVTGADVVSIKELAGHGISCQQESANSVLCDLSTDVIRAEGKVSTDMVMVLDGLWDSGGYENCAHVKGEGLTSNRACATVEIIREELKDDKVLQLELDKQSLGPCELDREAQIYRCPFGFEIRNTGRLDFAGPMVLTDQVIEGPSPHAVQPVTGRGWRCPGVSEGALTCLNGHFELAAGASDRLVVNVTLPGLRKGGTYCNRLMAGLGDDPALQTLVVQQAMSEMGIDGGPADGKAGPQTERGVRQLQARLGIAATGQINADLLTRIGVPGLDTRLKAEACIDLPPMPEPPLTCDPATTVDHNNSCACRYKGMVRENRSSCVCRKGTRLIKGRGCIEQIGDQPKAPKPVPIKRCDPKTTILRNGACACRFKGMKQVSSTQCQ